MVLTKLNKMANICMNYSLQFYVITGIIGVESHLELTSMNMNYASLMNINMFLHMNRIMIHCLRSIVTMML